MTKYRPIKFMLFIHVYMLNVYMEREEREVGQKILPTASHSQVRIHAIIPHSTHDLQVKTEDIRLFVTDYAQENSSVHGT